ncbi:hypothetical protein ABZP36_029680 [Zizania latifolia]
MRILFYLVNRNSDISRYNCLFFICLMHSSTELKRGRDEEFQNNIDELASELNRESITTGVFVFSNSSLLLVFQYTVH